MCSSDRVMVRSQIWFGLKATLEFSARPADVLNVPNSSAASARAFEGPKCINLRPVPRQPIVDRDEKVLGYELLYRDDMGNTFHGGDPDAASRSPLNRSLLLGLDVLCDGRRAFLNCMRETLMGGLVTLLPSHSTVIEIIKTVPVDAEVTTACQRLQVCWPAQQWVREVSRGARASPFEAGDPKLLETTGDVLLCKTRPLCHLRACTRTSTINLFLLASFPRRPSASQAVPGGATDPTTDNRYADIFIFSPIRVCFTRCG